MIARRRCQQGPVSARLCFSTAIPALHVFQTVVARPPRPPQLRKTRPVGAVEIVSIDRIRNDREMNAAQLPAPQKLIHDGVTANTVLSVAHGRSID
jgi:hypothetical protein